MEGPVDLPPAEGALPGAAHRAKEPAPDLIPTAFTHLRFGMREWLGSDSMWVCLFNRGEMAWSMDWGGLATAAWKKGGVFAPASHGSW